jgi:hypothetical protein
MNQGKPVQTTVAVGAQEFGNDLNINLQHFLFFLLRMASWFRDQLPFLVLQIQINRVIRG